MPGESNEGKNVVDRTDRKITGRHDYETMPYVDGNKLRPDPGQGLADNGNAIAVNVIDQDIVQLSSGSAVVAPGISADTRIDVYLDPSGTGFNSNDVKASARTFYDSSADEIKVEILEDGTSVGNPYVYYIIIEA